MKNQGYFSIVQYSEHPERIEFVNIGIVLFSPLSPSVLMRFSESPKRVERVFGVSLGSHFKLLQQSLENRVGHDFSSGWGMGSIEKFISMRAGKVRLSPPRSVLVNDAEQVLEQLFEELVVVGASHLQRHVRVDTKLKRKFETYGVSKILDRPEPVALEQGVTIKAPFAYQNGSYNLISAISLRGEPNDAIQNAAKAAVEGGWLYESTKGHGQKRLVVVGDVDGQEHNFVSAVSELMSENKVKFFHMDEMNPLVEDIRRHGTARH